jgi:hypothetical protein
MPAKSGMDAAPCLPLLAGPTAGATSCPKAGVAAAAANVTKRKPRRCTFMLPSLSWFRRRLPLRVDGDRRGPTILSLPNQPERIPPSPRASYRSASMWYVDSCDPAVACEYAAQISQN